MIDETSGLNNVLGEEHTELANVVADLIRAAVDGRGMDYCEVVGVMQCVLTDSVLLNELDPEHMLVAVIRDRVKREPNVQGGMQ